MVLVTYWSSCTIPDDDDDAVATSQDDKDYNSGNNDSGNGDPDAVVEWKRKTIIRHISSECVSNRGAKGAG